MTALGPPGSTHVPPRASSFTLGGIAFGPWQLDIAAQCLWRSGVCHQLTPLQFAALHLLVINAGTIVNKQTLLGDLDVIVAITAREDDVVAATWRIARRVEGQGTSTTAEEALPETDAIDASPGADAIAPSPAAASPPPVVAIDDALGRAS